MAQGSAQLKAAVQVTVDNTVDVLIAANPRQGLLIRNIGATTCYISGLATLTALTGMEIRAGEMISFTGEDTPQGGLWAITAAGSTTVIVQEID